MDLKLDNILERLDDFRSLFMKTELEKTKYQLKMEMNAKIEEVESEFFKKLNLTKKACEKAILKLKTSYNEEVASLKNLIKVFIQSSFRICMMKSMTLSVKLVLRNIRLNYIRKK